MTANDPTYTIRLDGQQLGAVDRIVSWVDECRDAVPGFDAAPRLRLGGLAGTGKSTLVQWIVRELGGQIAVCALAGKAAYVLRQKGIEQATTLHRTIYNPVAVCDDCGRIVSKSDPDDDPDCTHEHVTKTFRRKVLLPYDLVIVDEASMINVKLMKDLESFGRPVLYVGDHGQLEPIGDNPGLMVAPDIRLETIHRQAEGSAILQLATLVRQGHEPETTGPKATVVRANTMPRDAPEYDAIICGFNADRVAYNQWVRRRHGRTGPVTSGDRVVCLRNDHDLGVFNGMLATVTEARTIKSRNGREIPVLDIVDDVGERFESLPYEPKQFGVPETMRDVRKEKTLWDFGYALTCHKCQGSQFDRVLVLEQIASKWDPKRWRYTAVTRAADEIVYCVSDRRR